MEKLLNTILNYSYTIIFISSKNFFKDRFGQGIHSVNVSKIQTGLYGGIIVDKKM